ncbi:hypothetical protein ACS0TY_028301 [Phlomoides rotata]
MIVNSLFLAILCFLLSSSSAIRVFPTEYVEAPRYINGGHCENPETETSLVHVAMTLDSKYFRGSIASVNSILKHSDCPENTHFHFIVIAAAPPLRAAVESVFPSLNFQIYPFLHQPKIKKLISHSIRPALEDPLNYARIYLSEILDARIKRVVYIDSDTIFVDDIRRLWATTLPESRVIGAPEYCQVDLTKYYTNRFWSDPVFRGVFEGRSKTPCYFNTGVMVMDLEKWRKGDYTSKIEVWMRIQKERRIYELGSLPPLMLVFGGEIEGIDHRWNQHGLGGDNVEDSCRSLHPGRVSLMHWSGKGKPWVRLDEGRPCPVDHLWAPYDLHTFSNSMKH